LDERARGRSAERSTIASGPGGAGHEGGWDDGNIALTLDDLPDGVLVSTLDGRIQAANRAFLDLTGRNIGEVLGRPLEALVADEDMLNIVGFHAMFGERQTRDNTVIFLAPGGERRNLIVCSVRTHDEQRVTMTARASGTAQEALADESRAAVAEQERSLELARARDALATKNAALSAAQAELEAAYSKLQAEASTRERLENELRLAQRLESIGQLAAGVAHEINTPMQYIGDNVHFLSNAYGNILTYLEAVTAALEPATDVEQVKRVLAATRKKQRLPFLQEEVPKAIEAAREGVEHVSRIIRAMKSFAHQDQEEKSQHDINRTLQDALTVSQNEYRSVAVVQTDLGQLPSVRCFGGQLGQVFLNLIVNAAQAIEDAQRSVLGTIHVSTRQVDECVEVRISDDGCGIPEPIRHRVFDQFFTTKQVGRGSGQGLSLARSIIVDAHCGSIAFESQVGVGTTFTVRVPIDGTSEPKAVQPSSEA
jgi:PAS domain S-box-containing protein